LRTAAGDLNAEIFHTRQFMAGNSPAVRIPVDMAFPHQTKLVVIREGNRIIVEPETLASIPELFAALGKQHTGERPEFVEARRVEAERSAK
jgi:antitoxin VapB